MKPREIRQQVERNLIGKVTGALQNIAQIEAMLPHWDVPDEVDRGRMYAALGNARTQCNVMMELLSDDGEVEEP